MSELKTEEHLEVETSSRSKLRLRTKFANIAWRLVGASPMRRRDRIAFEVAEHLGREFPDHFYGAVNNGTNDASTIEGEIEPMANKRKAAGRPLSPAEIMSSLPDSSLHGGKPLFTEEGRFPARVIRATGGRIPDGYDGAYYAGRDGAGVERDIFQLEKVTSSATLTSPTQRVATLGPLPGTLGTDPDHPGVIDPS